MILLRPVLLDGDYYAIVNIRDRNFNQILDVVKDLEVREYIRPMRKYAIGFSSVKELVRNLKKKKINTPIIYNDDFYYHYLQWLGERKELMSIKNEIPVDVEIPGYNEHVGTEFKLFPFQTIGSHFLYTGRKVLLADVVGLGKTPQSIIASQKLLIEENYDGVIVVVPASLKRKWRKDIYKFLGVQTRVTLIEGSKKERIEQYGKFFGLLNLKNVENLKVSDSLEKNTKKNKIKNININLKDSRGISLFSVGNYLVLNYDIAHRDIEDVIIPLLEENKKKKYVIVFDEIQYLKNYQTKRHEACLEMAKYCKSIFGLSATLVETTIMDIFNILLVVNDTLLGTQGGRFYNRHTEQDYFGNVKFFKDTKYVEEITFPYRLRRHKEQVFDQLPERVEMTYWCELAPPQRKLYENVIDNIAKDIKSDHRKTGISTADVLSKVQYLIQACLHTELLDYKESISSKVELLKQVMEDMGEKKYVIFCRYTKMLEILKRELEKKYDGVVTAHGKNMPQKKRQELIDDFNDSEGFTKILLTSDIFKQGVDLVGASVLIHYDLLWNPAVMEQRSGRIDRIGQKANKIAIVYLVTSDTIEHRMYNILEERKELIDQLIEEGFKSDRIKSVNKRLRRELYMELGL